MPLEPVSLISPLAARVGGKRLLADPFTTRDFLLCTEARKLLEEGILMATKEDILGEIGDTIVYLMQFYRETVQAGNSTLEGERPKEIINTVSKLSESYSTVDNNT